VIAMQRRAKDLTAEELRAVADEYTGGASIRDIAVRLGRSYGFVHSRLHFAQVQGLTTVRARGSYIRQPRSTQAG